MIYVRRSVSYFVFFVPYLIGFARLHFIGDGTNNTVVRGPTGTVVVELSPQGQTGVPIYVTSQYCGHAVATFPTNNPPNGGAPVPANVNTYLVSLALSY